MGKHNRPPGNVRTTASGSGAGQPLAHNRAPAPDLAPWVARVYATVIRAPADFRLECGLLNDHPAIRIQLTGEWSARTADGELNLGPSALLFGPQSHRMPVSATGSFISIGVALRPGALHALYGLSADKFADRIADCSVLGLNGPDLLAGFDPLGNPDDWLDKLDDLMRMHVQLAKRKLPDPVTVRFEELAFTDPTRNIAEFARDCGIGQRRLERLVRRDFGLPPKQTLMRARALDMASYLHGVADVDEGDELVLRYYDQSHLIREFIDLFGMAPKQFTETVQPILTRSLETRQARRLEAIQRIPPGAPPPWEKSAIRDSQPGPESS
jgi:AraC-like DNA-binding protein